MAVPDLVNDNYVAICCDGVCFKQMWIEFEFINVYDFEFYDPQYVQYCSNNMVICGKPDLCNLFEFHVTVL